MRRSNVLNLSPLFSILIYVCACVCFSFLSPCTCGEWFGKSGFWRSNVFSVFFTYVIIYINIYTYICIYIYVCIRERERELLPIWNYYNYTWIYGTSWKIAIENLSCTYLICMCVFKSGNHLTSIIDVSFISHRYLSVYTISMGI